MAGSNLLPSAREEVIDPKSNKFTRGWLLFFEQIATRLLPLLSGNASEFLNGVGSFVSISAAPKDAEYLVATANATLTAERVTTDTTSITWDHGTAAQAKAKRAALTGDVTAGADSNATTIANNAVTNAKLDDMAAATFKLRAFGAGTGDPIDGTPNQASAILDTATDPFLRTSAAPAGSGTVTHTAGALTASAVMVGNGAADSKVLASLGSTTTVLHGNAAGLPTFAAVDLAADVTGDLPFANLTQGAALSVLGVTGNATADNASIAAGTDNQVLRRSGTAVAWGAVNLAAAAAVTGALPTANLGAGAVVQVVNVQNATVATGSTQIPTDNTIPQKTEGDEYMTLAITPKSATNKLRIEVVCNLTNATASRYMSAALFQDTTTDALASNTAFMLTAASGGAIVLSFYMTSGTTSATTFKVRAGANGTGTTSFNGSGGVQIQGGVMYSSITITEIAV